MRLLRIGLVALVAVPFAAAAGGRAAAPARHRCAAPDASVGSLLPAPVAVRTACGVFEIGLDGRARLASRDTSPVAKGAFEYSPFTGVWDGRDGGHLVIGRWRRTLWRSRRRFPRRPGFYDVSIAVGPHAVAFSAGVMRQRRLYVAPLGGRARLVARGEFPIGWTRGGFYAWGRPHARLLLHRGDGLQRTMIAPSVFTYAYDDGSLWLVRNGRLLRARGARVRRVAALAPLGLWPVRHLTLEPLAHGLVALEHGRRLVVLRSDGSLFASTYLAYGKAQADGVSAQPTAAPDAGAVAFATTRQNTGYGSRGSETIYVLGPGERAAHPVHTERVAWQTCGGGADLSWHGDWLLYGANEGRVALVDPRTRRTIDLTPLVRRLPGVRGTGSGLDVGVMWVGRHM